MSQRRVRSRAMSTFFANTRAARVLPKPVQKWALDQEAITVVTSW